MLLQITQRVEDRARAVAFYRDVVGLRLKFQEAGYAEFATQGTRFALYEARRAAWLTGRGVTEDFLRDLSDWLQSR